MITTLAGGVGAARFLEGLVQVISPEILKIIVNTGDDFVLHGLHISPDLDIITCTLAGIINQEQGWGIAGDTYACLDSLEQLGAPTWFKIGDQDLALHLQRTQLLNAGHPLTYITDLFRRALNVGAQILPMSNQAVPTHIVTAEGEMHFEAYLVERQAKDAVLSVRFVDVEQAKPAPGVLDAIKNADIILLGPSNPVVSIGPILAVPGIRKALQDTLAPIVGISPIVGGAAIKGPAVPLMQAVGLETSAKGVAQAYRDFLNVLIIDNVDAHLKDEIEALGIQVIITDTIMRNTEDKVRLAKITLAAAESYQKER